MKLYVDNPKAATKMAENMFETFWDKTKIKKAVLELKEDKLTRSQKQNALFWRWMKIMGDFIGHHQNEMAEVTKYELLGVKTYVSKIDNKEMTSLRGTSQLNVEEFSMFLEAINAWAGTLGIKLPQPEVRL